MGPAYRKETRDAERGEITETTLASVLINLCSVVDGSEPYDLCSVTD
jgi:hypothetical protein